MLETSGRTDLPALDLCSVESALLHHPNTSLHLLLTSPLLPTTASLHLLLRTYPTLVVQYLDLDSVFSGSPLSALWASGALHASSHPTTHLSDLLRFLLLHRC